MATAMISFCGTFLVSNTVSSSGTRKIRESVSALGTFIGGWCSNYKTCFSESQTQNQSLAACFLCELLLSAYQSGVPGVPQGIRNGPIRAIFGSLRGRELHRACA